MKRCCAFPEAINVLNLVFSLLGGEEARFGEIVPPWLLLFARGDEGVVERREKKDDGGEEVGLFEDGDTDWMISSITWAGKRVCKV